MTKRSVTHATFCIERVYDAEPARVFAAFADPAAKARWFSGPPDWQTLDETYDFRVGGHDRQAGRMPDGTITTFHGLYYDIVPNERIVFSYDMHLNDLRISVSLTTIELRPEAGKTRLVFTEQGAFLDGFDNVEGREEGTQGMLDALGEAIEFAKAH